MFIYTQLVSRAIEDITRHVGPLRHIDARKVLVAAARRVAGGRTGNVAQCYALNEPEVQDLIYWRRRNTRKVVRITPWVERRSPRVLIGGERMNYVIFIRMPRIVLRRDAIDTITHELIHISPDCDGRMRRARHGKRFDAMVRACVEEWRQKGNERLRHLLSQRLTDLVRQYGAPLGRCFEAPFVSPQIRPMREQPPVEQHPDFRSNKLEYDPKTVEVTDPKYSPDYVPEILTESDLAYRLYTVRSAERMPDFLVEGEQLDENGFPTEAPFDAPG